MTLSKNRSGLAFEVVFALLWVPIVPRRHARTFSSFQRWRSSGLAVYNSSMLQTGSEVNTGKLVKLVQESRRLRAKDLHWSYNILEVGQTRLFEMDFLTGHSWQEASKGSFIQGWGWGKSKCGECGEYVQCVLTVELPSPHKNHQESRPQLTTSLWTCLPRHLAAAEPSRLMSRTKATLDDTEKSFQEQWNQNGVEDYQELKS